MSEYRGKAIGETNINDDKVKITATNWIYGDFGIINTVPMIINKDGTMRFIIDLERNINGKWNSINLPKLLKNLYENLLDDDMVEFAERMLKSK